MLKRFILNLLCAFIGVALLSGCYKEQHFKLPGRHELDTVVTNLPFPFSPDRTAGVYVIRNGVPDYEKIAVRGFTDFVSTIGTESLSWYSTTDISGTPIFRSRPHKMYNVLTDDQHFGGNKFSYQCNDLVVKPFMSIGQGKNWYLYAKIAVGLIHTNTYPHFIYGGNGEVKDRYVSGYDWRRYSNVNRPVLWNVIKSAQGAIVSRTLYSQDFIQPTVPYELELVCVDGFIYCKIDGVLIWQYQEDLSAPEYARPVVFRPWGSSFYFYDMYIEGDYTEMPTAAYQQEEQYVSIQAPALEKAGGEVLLFAEAHVENIALSADPENKRSNASDIVMKRSTDGGDTWSAMSVLAGGDGSVNMQPCLVKGEDDKLYLFYTVDIDGRQQGNYEIRLKTSTDGGRSWSEATAIDLSAMSTNMTVTTSSGHGVLMSDNTKVIALSCKLGSRATLATLRSTDGITWTPGEIIDGLRNNYANLAEIDENGDKKLMILIASTMGRARKVIYSDDAGATWGVQADATVPTGNYGNYSQGATVTTAEGKLVHFTANGQSSSSTNAVGGGDGATSNINMVTGSNEFFIYPARNFSSGLTMTTSDDQGVTWSVPENMLTRTTYKSYNFLTGCMDAVLLDNGTVLCIVEGGANVPYEGLLCFKKSL